MDELKSWKSDCVDMEADMRESFDKLMDKMFREDTCIADSVDCGTVGLAGSLPLYLYMYRMLTIVMSDKIESCKRD